VTVGIELIHHPELSEEGLGGGRQSLTDLELLAAILFNQQHLMPGPRKSNGSGGSRRPSANDCYFELLAT
jgi:hypothetical protein